VGVISTPTILVNSSNALAILNFGFCSFPFSFSQRKRNSQNFSCKTSVRLLPLQIPLIPFVLCILVSLILPRLLGETLLSLIFLLPNVSRLLGRIAARQQATARSSPVVAVRSSAVGSKSLLTCLLFPPRSCLPH
jgi:hypothetical protein